MKAIRKAIFLLSVTLIALSINAQTDTEFWFSAPVITEDHYTEDFHFVITTGDLPAEVTIEQPRNSVNFPTQVINIPANTTYDLDVTADKDELENNDIWQDPFNDNSISDKGIHITSNAPITVYYEVRSTNNCDIFALKGQNAMGSDFYVPFQDMGLNNNLSWGEPGFSSVEIVAESDGTVVEISSAIPFFGDGTNQNVNTYTVTLDRGQVYTVPPAWDAGDGWFGVYKGDHLGGLYIHVQGDKRVAVSIKDDSVKEQLAGINEGCYDLIGDQLVPIDILGKEYIAMRGELVDYMENVFVVAMEPNTDIWFEGKDTVINLPDVTLNAGEQHRYEFLYGAASNDLLHIRANKKVAVLHVSGFGCEMGGAFLPPTDKCTGSTKVGFTRSTNEAFYLNIMVRDGAEDAFLVNGAAPAFFDEFDFSPIDGTSDWLGARLGPIAQAHIPTLAQTMISNTEDVFHLGVINGGSSSGCRFGYFSDFNELSVDAITTLTGSSLAFPCEDEPIQLYANGGTNYNWWPTSYLDDPTISTPVAVVDQDVLFFVEVSGACNQTDTATVLVDIQPQPEANFTVQAGSGCSPHPVEIRNQSLKTMGVYWDFNLTNIDGALDRDTTLYADTTNIDNTFTHIFNNTSFEPLDSAQTYTIQLFVETGSCRDTMQSTITVYPEVTADFAVNPLDDTVGCNPHLVQFQNASINEDAYKWFFGDGATSLVESPDHEYVNIYPDEDTLFTATLAIRSRFYCRDTLEQDILVYPRLEAGFTNDAPSGCAPHTVTLHNISAGEDSLYWDFGDGRDSSLYVCDSLVIEYNNTGLDPDTNIVVLEIFNDEGCVDTYTDTIIVFPQVIADYTIDATEGCNSQDVQFTDQSNIAATSWMWRFGDGSSSTQQNPLHTYTNTIGSDRTFDFELTASSVYGCNDDTTGQVTIYSANADFEIDTDEGCAPLDVNITNNSTGSITSYEWDYGDGTTAIGFNPNPLYTYYNLTGAPITDTIQLVVNGNGGCTDTMQLEVTSFSEITADFEPVDTVGCDSLVVDFRDLSSPWSTIYNWDFDDGTSSNQAEPSHVFRNLGAADHTYAVNLEVTSANGCSHDTTINVTVHPKVKASFYIDPSEGCSPYDLDVVPSAFPGNDSYSWDFDNAVTSNLFDPPIQNYTNNSGATDTYTIQLAVADPSGSCHDTLERQIQVHSAVTADFEPIDTAGCNPMSVQFRNNSSSWATAYDWDFGDGASASSSDPEHTYYNATAVNDVSTVALEVTTDEGCWDTTSTSVTVYPYVFADFSVSVSKGCSPLRVEVTNKSHGGNYRWYWDDTNLAGPADSTTNIQETFTHYFYHNGGGADTRMLTVIADNGQGCYDTLQRQITVYSSIDAQFAMSVNAGCNPVSVDFTNNTNFANDFTWDFGDGSNSNMSDPTHEFENPSLNDTTYTIKLYAESPFGCIDSAENTVEVYSYINARFSFEDDDGCPPFPVDFTNTSTGNPANTYEWYVDAGLEATSTDFSYTFTNPGFTILDYDVRLVAENSHGCTDEYIDQVRVFENVEATFTTTTNAGCNPLEIDFTNTSTAPTGSVYAWDFGDGATASSTSPSHTFYNYSRETDETFTVSLTVTSPYYCSDDATTTITSYHLPKASFEIDNTASCPPLVATMNNVSLGYDDYQWRFGDGETNSTDMKVTHEYPNPTDDVQPYELELYVETDEGCTDSSWLTLNVYPEVRANFSYDTSGCSPFVSYFVNESDNSDFYLWDFGDGVTSSQENPYHRYTNTDTTDIRLPVFLTATSEYDCWDTVTNYVTILAQPIAEFSLTPDLQQFPEARVFLENKTNIGPYTYLWDYDDGNTSTSREVNYHDYAHWGEFDISLEVTSKTSTCSDKLTKAAKILPPEVNASYTTDVSEGCEPLAVNFTAAASAFAESYDYDWDFGDGNTGSGRIIEHVFDSAGIYNVRLTATGEGGTDVEYKTITVNKNPVVDFTFAPALAMIPEDKVSFYNFSKYGDSYSWDFGDGTYSTERDPVHYYEDVGFYEVSLTVTSGAGCTTTMIHPDSVEVIGEGKMIFPNAFTPSPDGPSGGYYTQKDMSNDVFFPVHAGVVEYQLYIYNRWGELVFESDDVNIGWDGYIDGKLAKQDVYVWKVEGKFINGKAFEKAGDVTLLK